MPARSPCSRSCRASSWRRAVIGENVTYGYALVLRATPVYQTYRVRVPETRCRAPVGPTAVTRPALPWRSAGACISKVTGTGRCRTVEVERDERRLTATTSNTSTRARPTCPGWPATRATACAFASRSSRTSPRSTIAELRAPPRLTYSAPDDHLPRRRRNPDLCPHGSGNDFSRAPTGIPHPSWVPRTSSSTHRKSPATRWAFLFFAIPLRTAIQ